ncbi:MAG TPA: glycosyltransferase [Aequorivita sp.]|nr:glycosyltransferase [Aequorivita sp.]
MKLIINTSHQRFGGAIQVALSFIYECRHFPENDYHVWVGPGVAKSLNEKDFPTNFKFYYFDFGPIGFSTIKSIQQNLAPLEGKINPDIIIATSGPSYFHSQAPQVIGFNLPLYIYPESPYVKNLSFLKKLKLSAKKKIHFYYFKRDGIAFVVQTNDVNKRVKKALKTERVFTVTNTYNSFYKEPTVFRNKLPPRKEKEIRCLTISSYYGHKNLEIIPEIIKNLRKQKRYGIQFILTLKENDFKKKFGNIPEIINVGPIKPEECPSLYNECDFMFLPTLAECFSASYPEAMIMQKPIITTDLGFARSICGEAAEYYIPGDPKDASAKILNLISDESRQKNLQKLGLKELKKFDSAQERAEKYLEICVNFVKTT